jgi:hypothetical protein
VLLATARKIVIAVIGGTIILLGVLGWLIPVVPGFILIPIGLAVLATEFIWARRLLHRVKRGACGLGQVLRGVKSSPRPGTRPAPPR